MALGWLSNIGTAIQGGLGRFGQAAFPIAGAEQMGMTPDQVQAMQKQAMLRMGLGMLAANNQGMGFGRSALAGLGSGADYMQNASAQNLQALKLKQDAAERDYQRSRDTKTDEFRTKQIGLEERRVAADEAQAKAQAEYRTSALELQGRQAYAEIARLRAQGGFDAARTRQLEQTQKRLQELLTKPTKSEDDWREIQILSGHGLSSAVQSDPFGGVGLGGPQADPNAAILGVWDASQPRK